jgi:4-diphosphocytidyl-2-C-methyl-D-erythritol kinase
LERISLKAPAKINLYLYVLGKRDDGYHEIETLMQAVDFYDEIHLEKSDTIELYCSNPTLPSDKTNLAFRAASLMQEKFRFPGVRIELIKRIPIGAGLGGGSSDAAFVIRGLCRLFDLKPSLDEILPLAAELGSDVPFFLTDGQALAVGRGEILKPIKLPLDYNILITIPPISISTAEIYKNLKIGLTKENRSLSLKNKVDFSSFLFLAKIFGNDLEEVVLSKSPELIELKQSLLGTGAFYSSMSGSGSAFYGLFLPTTGFTAEYEDLKKLGCSLISCKPILLMPFEACSDGNPQ